jgi:NAD(P)-dependent dehydrogenase (short-subunit alcohol dehydrogenase family)
LGYKWGNINRDDLMSENSYSRIKAYCHSKLAVHLLAHELSKKLTGTGVTVNISMPGFVISDLVKRVTGVGRIVQVLEWIGSQFINTGKEGAQTTIFTAVDTDLGTITGKCFVNCKEIQPSTDSTNDESSAWLWKRGEELLGLNYV